MRYLLIILAFATVIVPGVVHGLWTERWYVSRELEEFTTRLANIPMNIQDWQGQDIPINPKQIARANLSGYVSRLFTHKASRRQITVLVSCGLPGPVSVHTPDICYEGSGYKQIDLTTDCRMNRLGSAATEEFQVATFMKSEPVPELLELFWSWNCTGNWETPANPRVAFGGRKALYKLYVICPFSQQNKVEEAKAASKSFMEVFLPELRRCLF